MLLLLLLLLLLLPNYFEPLVEPQLPQALPNFNINSKTAHKLQQQKEIKMHVD